MTAEQAQNKPLTPLLDTVDTPDDLRRLDPSKLRQLADELRLEMIDAVGQTAETLAAEFREPAEQAVKVDLALRSVADLQGLVPDDDRIDEVIAEMAGPSGQDPDELKARLAEVGQISALRADLAKQAAMEWLTDNVELVDEDGEAIDREALEFPARGAEEDSEEEE